VANSIGGIQLWIIVARGSSVVAGCVPSVEVIAKFALTRRTNIISDAIWVGPQAIVECILGIGLLLRIGEGSLASCVSCIGSTSAGFKAITSSVIGRVTGDAGAGAWLLAGAVEVITKQSRLTIRSI